VIENPVTTTTTPPWYSASLAINLNAPGSSEKFKDPDLAGCRNHHHANIQRKVSAE
jgi:hypothetical protein